MPTSEEDKIAALRETHAVLELGLIACNQDVQRTAAAMVSSLVALAGGSGDPAHFLRAAEQALANARARYAAPSKPAVRA